MAKRKAVSGQRSGSKRQKAEGSEQVVELREPEPVPGIEEYTKGTWAGKPHYRCSLCKFDTLNEDVMREHIQAVHRPRPAPERAPSVLVADKRGNDVTHQAASEDEGNLNELFEVELEEVESTTDEQGNEHKKFTIKE